MNGSFTISGGGPDIEDGTYELVLLAISDPKTIQTQDGPRDILEWKFAVLEGEYADTEINATTSTATSPRSKIFGFIAALTGKAPEVGDDIRIDQLVGRISLGVVLHNEKGYAKVDSLAALPRSRQQTALAQRTGAPVAQTRQPAPAAAGRAAGSARAAVSAAAAADDGLPF